MSADLSPEQEAFLEECALEFSDRFTDADLEYKKIFDIEIPPPPIMCPWFRKSRFNHRFNDRRDHRGQRDRNHQNQRDGDYQNNRNDRHSNYDRDHSRSNYSMDRNSHKDSRYRPYN